MSSMPHAQLQPAPEPALAIPTSIKFDIDAYVDNHKQLQLEVSWFIIDLGPSGFCVGATPNSVACVATFHWNGTFALGVDARIGIEHIVGEVLPSQQQHGRQQKQQQLVGPHRQAPSPAPALRR